jgi:hypothetical protein
VRHRILSRAGVKVSPLCLGTMKVSAFPITIDGQAVGAISGGHVEYEVTPSCRNRGVATSALRLGLRQLGGMGVERALVTRNADNSAEPARVFLPGRVREFTSQLRAVKPSLVEPGSCRPLGQAAEIGVTVFLLRSDPTNKRVRTP